MHLKSALGSAAAGLVVATAAGPALGFADPYKYYSASNPLTAWDNGVAQAEMHGKFLVENATYLRNNTNQRDPRPGGDKVFERTQYWFYVWDPYEKAMVWKLHATDQGPKTDDGSWYSQYDHSAFISGADKGRMRTQVCEDHGVFPDPCSVWPQWTTDL